MIEAWIKLVAAKVIKKWSGSGYGLKVMPTRFADALGVRYEIKKEIKDDTKVYGLSN